MMAMQLSAAAQVLQGQLFGPDVPFAGVSTDTRTLEPGNLFVALKGPNFDGQDFLDQAGARGAAAATVMERREAELPQLQVEDTRLALGRLAAHWRSRFQLPLVAVTGSNGKTTVKEMLAAILRLGGETLVTRGNLNNDIGVPLTLSRLASSHRAAVIEMGANHAGEIAYLTALARPTVGLVNNAGPAHLEGFGSLSGVAEAKGELFRDLPATATAVVNADDRFAPLWRRLAAPRRTLNFGLDSVRAEIRGTWQGTSDGGRLALSTPFGNASLHLPLPGRHNAMNALAAAAAALATGAALDQVVTGLEGLQGVGGRLQQVRLADGSLVLDDTYNANPASLRAGIEVLALATGPKWLVLGDMAELGAGGQRLHRQVAKFAREQGVDRLFALGPLACGAVEVFGRGGECFQELEALIEALLRHWRSGATLLVKGSRSMAMERVVAALHKAFGGES